jgi:hypothetical protein
MILGYIARRKSSKEERGSQKVHGRWRTENFSPTKQLMAGMMDV